MYVAQAPKLEGGNNFHLEKWKGNFLWVLGL